MRAVEALVRSSPTIARPHRLPPRASQSVDPVWTREGLWSAAPRAFRGLVGVAAAGPARWDPSSANFFAVVGDALVRVDPGGSLIRLIGGVRGTDFDIRTAANLIVVREDGERIVAQWPGFGGSPASPVRRVLWQGGAFFAPRLSPDGTKVLVEESRAAGGHVHVASLDGITRDLGAGYGPAWWPDSRRIVITEVIHDGARITASELLLVDIDTGLRVPLARTPDSAEVEPAVSLDGRWIAWRDALTEELCIAAMPTVGR